MGKAARPVRHLQLKDGRYRARIAVPAALVPIIGKRELLEPLGADRGLAIVKLHAAVAGFHAILADARRGVKPTPPVVSMRRAVHDHYAGELTIDERIDLRGEPGRGASTSYSEHFAGAYLRALRKIAGGYITDAERAESFVQATIGWAVDEACERQGRERPDPASPAYIDLAAALATSQIEAMERTRERDRGDWTGKPTFRLLAEPVEQPVELPPMSIEGLLDSYLAMRARTGVGEAAGKRWRPCFARLVKFLGHDDARQVTKADLQRWLDHLRDAGLAEKTIRDVDLGGLRAVMGYAVEQDQLPRNPAQHVRVRLGRRVQGRDPGFDQAEAEAIIAASRSYQPKLSSNPATREGAQLTAAKRWAPILCAHSGARITEVCQLRKEDVRERDGIAYLRLTPDAGSIKTGQFRDVPLHPQLVELGFLAFVEAAAPGPMFYRADPNRKGTTNPAQTVSGRVSQWLQDAGLIPENLQPNHGWRHRLKTVGREAGIDPRVLDAIQGHAARTAGDSYGDITMTAKLRALCQLPHICVRLT